MKIDTAHSSGYLSILRRMDVIFLLLCGIMIFTGCLFVYGAGQQIGGNFARFWWRQLLWIGLGLVSFVVVSWVDYRRLGWVSVIAYVLGLLGLVAVLFVGKEINSARSWFDLKFATIQPAELMKPLAVLFLSWLASRHVFHLNRWSDILFYGVMACLPFLLVARQPDWGTALVFVPLALGIAFVAGLPWKTIVLGILICLLAAPLAYQVLLGERQKGRIQTFLRPSEDISDAGWNAHQSLLAVGSGGKYGKGFMKGNQHVLGYLPRTVAPTDFIFSVIGEETGLIGAGAMVCAFLALLVCCLRTAALAPDSFGTYICVAVAAVWFAHAYVNIGMTIRAAPIIGIPLPFISYGGSFMLSMLTCAGLVQNVHARRLSPEDRARLA